MANIIRTEDAARDLKYFYVEVDSTRVLPFKLPASTSQTEIDRIVKEYTDNEKELLSNVQEKYEKAQVEALLPDEAKV